MSLGGYTQLELNWPSWMIIKTNLKAEENVFVEGMAVFLMERKVLSWISSGFVWLWCRQAFNLYTLLPDALL